MCLSSTMAGATNFPPVCCAHSPFGGNSRPQPTQQTCLFYLFLHFNLPLLFRSPNFFYLLWFACILLVTMFGKENDNIVRMTRKIVLFAAVGRKPVLHRTENQIAPNYSPIHFWQTPWHCQSLLCLYTKIPFLDGAVGKGLQSAYTKHCNGADINPHERFLIVKDPTLVRAGQLTCLNLLSRLPTQHQADFVVRINARIEEKFNSLLREDLMQRTINVNGEA